VTIAQKKARSQATKSERSKLKSDAKVAMCGEGLTLDDLNDLYGLCTIRNKITRKKKQKKKKINSTINNTQSQSKLTKKRNIRKYSRHTRLSPQVVV
jgi:hypothetical protein